MKLASGIGGGANESGGHLQTYSKRLKELHKLLPFVSAGEVQPLVQRRGQLHGGLRHGGSHRLFSAVWEAREQTNPPESPTRLEKAMPILLSACLPAPGLVRAVNWRKLCSTSSRSQLRRMGLVPTKGVIGSRSVVTSLNETEAMCPTIPCWWTRAGFS